LLPAAYGQEPAWGDLYELAAAAESAGAEGLRDRIRQIDLFRQTYLPLEELARRLNPILRGWIQYYGRFYPTELRAKLFSYLNQELSAGLRQKHQRLRRKHRRSRELLTRIAQQRPALFAHWHGGRVVAG
jgi:hypothetical protein